MKRALSLIAIVAAMPATAEDTREADAHEHGVGALNIAIDGTTVAMEFEVPGADIVGFEYEAESDADLAAIDAALETLNSPLALFAVPDDAACTVTAAEAELESEEDHDEHGLDDHDEHAEDEHDHDEHAHDDHDDHGDEGYSDHPDEASHTEFHAEYMLACENPDALTEITFAYFDAFPNAKEVEVQLITASGAQAFEVARDAPVLNLAR